MSTTMSDKVLSTTSRVLFLAAGALLLWLVVTTWIRERQVRQAFQRAVAEANDIREEAWLGLPDTVERTDEARQRFDELWLAVSNRYDAIAKFQLQSYVRNVGVPSSARTQCVSVLMKRLQNFRQCQKTMKQLHRTHQRLLTRIPGSWTLSGVEPLMLPTDVVGSTPDFDFPERAEPLQHNHP